MTESLPDPVPHLREPEAKRRYTRRLFDVVAPRYDRFTRWFSFGMDAGWKRVLAWEVARRLPADALVVDLACGTGDLMSAVRRYPRELPDGHGGTAVHALGLDPSMEMLARARTRSPACRVIGGDMTAIALRNVSVDAVTVGYGLRNAPDLDDTLEEIRRVMRPGGVLGTLDFFLPGNAVWRRLFRWYLRRAGRLMGRWWHRDPHVYGYIEASLRAWVTADELSRRLGRHGFAVETEVTYLMGGIGLHVARRR